MAGVLMLLFFLLAASEGLSEGVSEGMAQEPPSHHSITPSLTRKQRFTAALDAADAHMSTAASERVSEGVREGALRAALEAFEEAHSLNPRDVYTMQGAATALSQMRQFSAAAKYFELAANTNKMPQFFMNAGMTYERASDWESAMSSYHHCLTHSQQQFKPCHIKLAGIYNHMGDFQRVQQHLQLALQLDPTDVQAYTYLGDVYNNLKQFSMAIDVYKQSLAYAASPPQLSASLTAIADTYSNLKQYHSAEEYYSRALNLAASIAIPPSPDLLLGTLFNQLQTGRWLGYERTVAAVLQECQRLAELTEGGPPSPLSPYRGLFLPVPPAVALSTAQSWARGFLVTEQQNQIDSDKTKRSVHESPSLRVSYLSRRFEDYPGTQMMLRLFSKHNRSRVMVSAHAHGPDDGSSYRAYIRKQADNFADLSSLSDTVAARKIEEDRIDILVSYDGMHDFNSVKVLMKRPAAIQMTWLGFAATTGFKPKQGIDYAIADSSIAPPDGVGAHFSEKLVFMPDTYQPQDELQGGVDVVSEEVSLDETGPLLRAQHNAFINSTLWFTARDDVRRELLLQHSNMTDSNMNEIVNAFWFICFNRVEKITPEVFGDWMRILSRASAPTESKEAKCSVLVLFSQSPEIDAQLQRNAAAHGVSGANRLVFLRRMPKADYMNALAVADLFLDTPHYGAHTTASDALYGTLPVLTLPRETVASRVASSLNSAISLPFLNAASPKEYEDIAVRLFKSRTGVLARIRQHIASSLGTVLFNSERFAGQLERAYQAVFELHPSFKHVYHME